MTKDQRKSLDIKKNKPTFKQKQKPTIKKQKNTKKHGLEGKTLGQLEKILKTTHIKEDEQLFQLHQLFD